MLLDGLGKRQPHAILHLRRKNDVSEARLLLQGGDGGDTLVEPIVACPDDVVDKRQWPIESQLRPVGLQELGHSHVLRASRPLHHKHAIDERLREDDHVWEKVVNTQPTT